jgi:hypothetical protein
MWAAAGIGVGSLELALPRSAWRAGEIVHGRVALRLEEPLPARRLVVGVLATEQRCFTDGRGRIIHETRTRYRIQRQLAGRRSYHGDVYDFQLPLPALLGYDWCVYASLDGILDARSAITVE